MVIRVVHLDDNFLQVGRVYGRVRLHREQWYLTHTPAVKRRRYNELRRVLRGEEWPHRVRQVRETVAIVQHEVDRGVVGRIGEELLGPLLTDALGLRAPSCVELLCQTQTCLVRLVRDVELGVEVGRWGDCLDVGKFRALLGRIRMILASVLV